MACFSGSLAPLDDCMLGYVRALTRPPITPPRHAELADCLMNEWGVRIPINTDDPTTTAHWNEQKHTQMFTQMFHWDETAATSTRAKLHPYFSFGRQAGNPFFAPCQDVADCLKHLLLHRIGWEQHGPYTALVSHDVTLFLSTNSNFNEDSIHSVAMDKNYYMLRCHFDKRRNELIFGYHSYAVDANSFQRLHTLSLAHEDWRLHACIILKNIARIIHVLKDYSIPLSCNKKLSAVGNSIQKIYLSDNCGAQPEETHTTVTNMIEMYRAIADVPHTDKLIFVEETAPPGGNKSFVCRFAPIGRCYLPENIDELMDALLCVTETLVAIHAKGIMHRDIRWANIFHAFESPDATPTNLSVFTREWVLFDFEFAAFSPQPELAAHSLTPGNHAPEMIHDAATAQRAAPHTTAVDIWGIGYLITHCAVDIPSSHYSSLEALKESCLQVDPSLRPTATECLAILSSLQSLPRSSEKNIDGCSSC